AVRLCRRNRDRGRHAGFLVHHAAHHQPAAGVARPHESVRNLNRSSARCRRARNGGGLMASALILSRPVLPAAARPSDVTTERRGIRWLLIGVTVAFLGIFLFLPLAVVFASALAKGFSVYFE